MLTALTILIGFQIMLKRIFISLILIGLTSCTLLSNFNSLKLNNQRLDEKSAIVGVLPTLAWQSSDVIIMLIDIEHANPTAIASTQAKEGGFFTFATPRSGKFLVIAYGDTNHDGNFSADEIWASSKTVIKESNEQSQIQKIALTEQSSLPPPKIKRLMQDVPTAAHSKINAGKILDLSDAQFSFAAAETGVWTSLEFINTYGIGTYFLQPWQENARPVILVHGFAGYPQQFNSLVPKLREAGYQPWVFHYPSGLSVDKAALILKLNIEALKRQHQFKSIAIIAHSVGGLVAREAINLYPSTDSPISLFISMSTPWGGNEMAEKGIKRAPSTIHAWHQIASNSNFITNLFEPSLPSNLNHYLMFSFNGTNRWIQGNNDGSITIESQLHQPAQLGAYQMRGFNLGHVAILNDDLALNYIINTMQNDKAFNK